MIATRRFATKIVPGTVALYPSATIPAYEHKEPSPSYLKIAGYVAGHELLATAATFVVPLPAQYVNTSRLYCQYRTEGNLQITTTTPTHTNVVIVTGGTTQKGRFTTIDFVNSISINNPTAGNVQFSYVLFILPDLTLPASFYTG